MVAQALIAVPLVVALGCTAGLAARALTGSPTTVDDGTSPPADEAAAPAWAQEVATAFSLAIDPRNSVEDSLRHIADDGTAGSALERHRNDMSDEERQRYTVEVANVDLDTSGDRVVLDVRMRDRLDAADRGPAPWVSGQATRSEDGTWLVTSRTVCRVLSTDSAVCP